MKQLFTLLAAAVMLSACGGKTPETVELFNGTDFTGWTAWLSNDSLNTADEFKVVDGVIRFSGKFGYLQTEKTYSDYTLEFEYRWIDTATNSGVFVHAQPPYQEWPMCYECQLCVGKAGDLINMSGSSSAEFLANSGNIVIDKQNPSNERPVGEWNEGKVICDGNTVTAYINGLLQNRITETSLTSGHIALQSEGEAVEFRNVRLTPLGKK